MSRAAAASTTCLTADNVSGAFLQDAQPENLSCSPSTSTFFRNKTDDRSRSHRSLSFRESVLLVEQRRRSSAMSLLEAGDGAPFLKISVVNLKYVILGLFFVWLLSLLTLGGVLYYVFKNSAGPTGSPLVSSDERIIDGKKFIDTDRLTAGNTREQDEHGAAVVYKRGRFGNFEYCPAVETRTPEDVFSADASTCVDRPEIAGESYAAAREEGDMENDNEVSLYFQPSFSLEEETAMEEQIDSFSKELEAKQHAVSGQQFVDVESAK